jgi:hypothetical protein
MIGSEPAMPRHPIHRMKAFAVFFSSPILLTSKVYLNATGNEKNSRIHNQVPISFA